MNDGRVLDPQNIIEIATTGHKPGPIHPHPSPTPSPLLSALATLAFARPGAPARDARLFQA